VTFIRDVPGWATYFYAYEYFKRVISSGINSHDNLRLKYSIMIFSGGTAGVVSWLVSYPFDVIKSDI